MITMPKRSVTRFFIPLIDVLLLLFCIFLLMPLVKATGDGTADAEETRDEKLRRLEAEIERLRQQGQETPQNLRDELERLRQEKLTTLQERLAIRVLEIEASDGRLFYRDPERVDITNEARAHDLIAQDKARQGGKKEIYYLILYPRDASSPFPHRDQFARYDRWFADVAHGWDVPGTAGGGRSVP
jgi:hypothetical protein